MKKDRIKSTRYNLKSIITLITFNPPPVDPAHAPIKLIAISNDMINEGQE